MPPHRPGSWRRKPLPPGWQKIRAAVLDRDGHQCTIMLTPSVRCPGRGVVADHIDQDGPQADMANLRSLCLAHDKVISSGQGGAGWAKIRRQVAAAKTRPAEKHPGLR